MNSKLASKPLAGLFAFVLCLSSTLSTNITPSSALPTVKAPQSRQSPAVFEYKATWRLIKLTVGSSHYSRDMATWEGSASDVSGGSSGSPSASATYVEWTTCNGDPCARVMQADAGMYANFPAKVQTTSTHGDPFVFQVGGSAEFNYHIPYELQVENMFRATGQLSITCGSDFGADPCIPYTANLADAVGSTQTISGAHLLAPTAAYTTFLFTTGSQPVVSGDFTVNGTTPLAPLLTPDNDQYSRHFWVNTWLSVAGDRVYGYGNDVAIYLGVRAEYGIDPLPRFDAAQSYFNMQSSPTCITNWDNGTLKTDFCYPIGPGADNVLQFSFQLHDQIGNFFVPHRMALQVTRACGPYTESAFEMPVPIHEPPYSMNNWYFDRQETAPGLYTYRGVIDGVVMAQTYTVRWYGPPDYAHSRLDVSQTSAVSSRTFVTATVYAYDACNQLTTNSLTNPTTNVTATLIVNPAPTSISPAQQMPLDVGSQTAFLMFFFSLTGRFNVSAKVGDVLLAQQYQITVLPTQHSIGGRVTTPPGAPAPQLFVTAQNTSTLAFSVVQTDNNGFYLIPLPGDGTYKVFPGGLTGDTNIYTPANVTLSLKGLANSNPLDVNFIADDHKPVTSTISGQVLDRDGHGLAGVSVQANSAAPVRTDGNGGFSLVLQAGSYAVTPWLASRAFAPSQVNLRVPPNASGITFREVTSTLPMLTATPARIAAGSSTPVQVRLSNAAPGDMVLWRSSRGMIDSFNPARAIIDAGGAANTQLRSSAAGQAVVSVEDLTIGKSLDVSARVTFTATDVISDPIGAVGPKIVALVADLALDGAYLQGVSVKNPVTAMVDWGDSPPGLVQILINGRRVVATPDDLGYVFTLDMGNDLQPGTNNLVINAVDAYGKRSPAWIYQPVLMAVPKWLPLANFLVPTKLKPSFSVGFHWPATPFNFDATLPAQNIKPSIDWGMDGQVVIAVDCNTAMDASLKAYGAFKITDKSSISIQGIGGLKAQRNKRAAGALACILFVPTGYGTARVEGKLNVFKMPVLLGIAYLDPVAGPTLAAFVQSTRLTWLIDRFGEIGVDLKSRIDATTKISCPDSGCAPSDLVLGGGGGVEAYYQASIGQALQLRLSASADAAVTLNRPGPITWPPTSGMHFDTFTIKGEGAYYARVYFYKEEGKLSIEWTAQLANMAAAPDASRSAPVLTLIPHPAPQHYAEFNAGTVRRPAFVASTPLAASTVLTSVLVSNVYSFTHPALALSPTGNGILLWTHDDLAKPVGKSLELNYSTWTSGAWSTPAPVMNDLLLDDNPQVAWNSAGEAVAVWQRLTSVQPITSTWNITTARQMQIASAVFNPISGTWSPVTLVTTNTALHQMPVLARSYDGQVLAVWKENNAGQMMGDASAPDAIYAARYDHGWLSPTLVVSNGAGIADLGAAVGASEAIIAWSRDLTPTTGVSATLQVFTSRWNGAAWSAPAQRTDDAFNNWLPRLVYNTSNQPLLIWLAKGIDGNHVRLRNLTTGVMSELQLPADIGNPDDYRVAADTSDNIAVTFGAQMAQRDLYVAYFNADAGVWGLSQPLTSDRNQESTPAVAIDSAGRLLAAYADTVINDITATTIISGEVVTYTLPVEGQTDLLTLAKEFAHNVTISDSDIVAAPYTSGANGIVVTATVHNSGDLPISNLQVRFYDGDPAHNGFGFHNVAISNTLLAGATSVVTATFVPILPGALHTVTVVADPINLFIPVSSTTKTGHVLIAPDLQLQAWADVPYSGTLRLHGIASELRGLAAPTSTISYYAGDINGAPVATATVPWIQPGQSALVDSLWAMAAPLTGVLTMTAVINRADFDELSKENNFVTGTITALPDLLLNPYDLAITTTNGVSRVQAMVYNAGLTGVDHAIVRIYAGDDIHPPAQVATITVGALAMGSGAPISVTLPPLSGCSVTLEAYADPPADELLTNNNTVGYSWCAVVPYHQYVPITRR